MKVFCVILVVIAAALLSIRCEPRASPQSWQAPPSVPRPVPLQPSDDIPTSGISLSDWVNRNNPQAARMFALGKNALNIYPSFQFRRYIEEVCVLVGPILDIQKNYRPNIENLQVVLYAGNKVVRASLQDLSPLAESEHFNPRNNVTVFVTGWETENQSPLEPYQQIIRAYKQRPNTNFIVYDAGEYVKNLYHWATIDAAFFGNALKSFLAKTISDVPAEKIHLIGHGAGADIAASVGYYYQREKNQKIGRITGLDPSIRCVSGGITLVKGIASFVDVIHTSPGVLGAAEDIGDVDFYPNGLQNEQQQPGCYSLICGHDRAVEYYAETVIPGNENNFLATKYQDNDNDDEDANKYNGPKIPMGYSTPVNARGVYYVKTN